MSDKPDNAPSHGQLLVYRTESGKDKIEVRLEGETAWLTQAHMAELFQTTVPNISMHLRNIFEEGELQQDSVVKDFLSTASDGINYRTKHCNFGADGQALRRVPMHMNDWIAKLHAFLNTNDRDILTHAGQISHEMARELAEAEYDKFNRQRIRQSDMADGDFERAIKDLPSPPKSKKTGGNP